MPAVSDHNHEQVTVNHWIRVAKNKIFSSIDSELFCKVQEQYEIGVRETLELIGDNENMKEAFYQFMPSFLSLKRTLYRHRNIGIPSDPINQCDIDTENDFFKLRDELIVVGSTIHESHNRGILLFSHSELIKQARANILF